MSEDFKLQAVLFIEVGGHAFHGFQDAKVAGAFMKYAAIGDQGNELESWEPNSGPVWVELKTGWIGTQMANGRYTFVHGNEEPEFDTLVDMLIALGRECMNA